MEIEFDLIKRAATLAGRKLDFADAAKVFAGATLTVVDDRHDYGEVRYITIGRLARRMVVLVWTQRGAARRLISIGESQWQGTSALRPPPSLIRTTHRTCPHQSGRRNSTPRR